MRLWRKRKMNTSSIQTIVNGLPFAALITTANADEPVILAANQMHEKLTGWKTADIIGKSPRIFKGPKTDPTVSAEIKKEMRETFFSNVDVTNHRPDGSDYSINLTIIGATIDGQRYYVALKKLNECDRIRIPIKDAV